MRSGTSILKIRNSIKRARRWAALGALGLSGLATAASETAAPAAASAGLQYSYVEGAGGVPLSVAQVGAADTPGILFIHGIGQSHLSFARQLAGPLAQHYHLVAFDLRGHGNSGKPWNDAAYLDSAVWAEDVQRVIAATGLERPLVVAWSYGTLVVADYIRHHGTDRIGGIVMIGATGGLVPYTNVAGSAEARAKMKSLYQLAVSPGLENTLLASRGTVPWLTYKPMPPDWTATAETVNALVPPYARGALVQHLYSNNTDIVGRVHVPVLLMAGAEDRGDPESLLRTLADALPLHADIKIYAGTGHSVFAEEPEKFDRDLDAFTRSALAAR